MRNYCKIFAEFMIVYEFNQRLTVATLSLLTMISSSGAAIMWMHIFPKK